MCNLLSSCNVALGFHSYRLLAWFIVCFYLCFHKKETTLALESMNSAQSVACNVRTA